METIRTFISLNLEEPVKTQLALDQNKVKKGLEDYDVKWENPKKFHLTLRFLGDLNSAEITDLKKEIGRVRLDFDNIVYFTNETGYFPNARYPNVVYVDLVEKDSNTLKLITELDKVLAEFDLKQEKKFVPHITFGRFKRDKRKLLDTNLSFDIQKTEIMFENFCLMKSILKDTGSEYEEIKRYSFSQLQK